MVANKLKKALGKVVGEFQTASVEGRSISDNYIVAHESWSGSLKIENGLLGPSFDQLFTLIWPWSMTIFNFIKPGHVPDEFNL